MQRRLSTTPDLLRYAEALLENRLASPAYTAWYLRGERPVAPETNAVVRRDVVSGRHSGADEAVRRRHVSEAATITTAVMAARRDILRRIRKIWAGLGAGAIVIFVAWSAVAFRASSSAQGALISDSRVVVKPEAGRWRFTPKDGEPRNAALLFFPGAMVDPAAYAPLIRGVALAGYRAVLMELPRRGVLGGADGADALGRAVMNETPDMSAWVVAGHSRGAVVATTLAHQGGPGIAGLVLIGTTHPRDFTLADTRFPVTKILGTKDGIAPVATSEANRRLLPKDARWVVIEGANHSQFGSYGFQPGDRFATIDRTTQQGETLREIVAMLEAASRNR